MTNDAERAHAMRDFLVSEDIRYELLVPDDRQAAQAHLDAGRPIYYCEDAYPDEMVRKWPSGECELVSVAYDGTISHTRTYPKSSPT